MKTHFILVLVLSLLYHDCRATVLENQILLSRPVDNGYLQSYMKSHFLPSNTFARQSKSEAISQAIPIQNGDKEQWQETLYGRDPKQIIYGGITGWFAGFVAMKVSKVAATAVTGGAILIALANYNEFISINWDNINNGVNNVSTALRPESQSWGYRISVFANENKHAALGFGLGFILGVFSS